VTNVAADRGGYYYYLTEAGRNYAQTMLDVHGNLSQQEDLPVQHWQFDSWWYR
jgi:hypothetical protein